MKRLLAITAFVLAACFVVPVHAQDTAKKKRKPRVIELEEIRIEGRVQKPNAFYILNRSNIGYEVMDLRNEFLREIVRSVQRKPF